MRILALDGFEIIAIAMAIYPLAQLVGHRTGIAEVILAFLDCASIFFGIFWENEHIFCFFLKKNC